jgi:hypothetical protein
MLRKINLLLDVLADFIAHRKGLLPLIGIVLVVLNYILQLIPGSGWWVESNLLLHLGIVVAILGFLFAWAL